MIVLLVDSDLELPLLRGVEELDDTSRLVPQPRGILQRAILMLQGGNLRGARLNGLATEKVLDALPCPSPVSSAHRIRPGFGALGEPVYDYGHWRDALNAAEEGAEELPGVRVAEPAEHDCKSGNTVALFAASRGTESHFRHSISGKSKIIEIIVGPKRRGSRVVDEELGSVVLVATGLQESLQ